MGQTGTGRSPLDGLVTVAGTVLDQDGQPIPAARVTVVEDGRVTAADDCGNYRITGLQPGAVYTLAIAVPGFMPAGRYPLLDRNGEWVETAGGRIRPVLAGPQETVQMRVQMPEAGQLTIPPVRFVAAQGTNSPVSIDSVSIPVISPSPGTPLPRNSEVTIRARVKYHLRSGTQGAIGLMLFDESDRSIKTEPVLVDDRDGEISLSLTFTTTSHGRLVQPIVALFSNDAEATGVWTSAGAYSLAGIPNVVDYPDEEGHLVSGILIPDPKRGVLYGLTDEYKLIILDHHQSLIARRSVPGGTSCFALSPEGDYLYFGNQLTTYIHRLDLRTGEWRAIPSKRLIARVIPTGTNLLLYFSGETNMLHVVDENTGEELFRTTQGFSTSYDWYYVAYVPRSRSLLLRSPNHYRLARYRLESSGEIVLEQDSSIYFPWTPIIVEPDGLHFWAEESRYAVGDLTAPPSVTLPRGSRVQAVSPDGRLVAAPEARRIYDSQTGEVVYSWESGYFHQFGPDSSSAWFSEYGISGIYGMALRKVTW
ncbi:MAG: carboxypeptidase regulatory-like domain-containing protein [Limnochordales bacterium]|nr:carboxypeptidase regulatory-like domain-containing protein [Limnochordales bacterium]